MSPSAIPCFRAHGPLLAALFGATVSVAACSSTSAERTTAPAPTRDAPLAQATPPAEADALPDLNGGTFGHHLQRMVHVVIPPSIEPGPGQVSVTWYTQAEWDAKQAGTLPFAHINEMIPRVRVRTVDDLTATPRVDVVLHTDVESPLVFEAVLDRGGKFWSSWFGGKPAGNYGGNVAQAAAHDEPELLLEPFASRPPRPEGCSGPRYQLHIVEAPEVAGTLGNPVARRLCVVVPEGYDPTGPRHYPVIYLLPGMFGNDLARLQRGHHDVVTPHDAHPRQGILVGVDSSNVAGTSYFMDNDLSGSWLTYLTDRVVPFIDEHYRTLPTAEARALVGSSTGGHTALSVALRRPDLFATVGADAPDSWDLADWITDDGKAVPLWLAWMRLEAAVGMPGQFLSYAADLSPRPGTAPGYAWPVDLRTGAVVEDVLAEWHHGSPAGMLANAGILEGARERLGGRIFVTVGKDDEFLLAPAARDLHAALQGRKIEHGWLETEGGHFSHRAERLEAVTHFVLEKMPPAGP